jgi:hypothetical protein
MGRGKEEKNLGGFGGYSLFNQGMLYVGVLQCLEG